MADQQTDEARPRSRWPLAIAAIVLIAFVVAVIVIDMAPTAKVWTDDAYVQVHYASVTSRIGGQVVSVETDDNEPVRAGQLVVRLDDRDQLASLDQATATLARDRAQFRDALATVSRQPSLIDQQSSQTDALVAQLGLARQNQTRYRNLAKVGAGTEQSRQSADANVSELQAQLAGSKAATEAARHQLDVLQASADADRARIAADEAQLRQAQLALSYTRITAPIGGTVTERSVQVGDYLSPGKVVMSLVPLDQLYIVANYRELALRHVLPGQHVRIHVDAYDILLDGVVQGVPPASGAIYSPIPSNNATGNFTKIVQRLPVKIVVAPGQPLAKLLRAGFSVETTIDTHDADVRDAQATSPDRVTAR